MSEPDDTIPPFGRWVLAVLKKHRATYRSQRARTKIPHSTVLGWVQGIPPRMENVLAFARGMDEDEGEALEAAGYSAPESLGDFFLAEYSRLLEKFEGHARAVAVVERHASNLAGLIRKGQATASEARTAFEVAEEEAEQEVPRRGLVWHPELSGALAGHQGPDNIPTEDVAEIERLQQERAAEQRRKQGRE